MVKKEEPHSPPCGRLYLGCWRGRLVLLPSPKKKKWLEVELEM
jgi:hypothetical protein